MKNILLIMSLLFVYGILLAADGTDWYHIKIGDDELVGKDEYKPEESSCQCPCTKGVYVDNVWNNPLYICYSETYPYAREADWSREAQGIAYFSEEYYFYSHADPAQGDGGIGLFPVNDFGSSSATLSLNTIVSDMVDKECFIDEFSDDEDNSHIGEITYDHEKDLLYVVVTPERGKEDALASYSYVNGEYVLKSCIKDFLDAALFFNRIDGLLYYSFNNSEIRGFDPNSYENDSWSDDMFSRKIMLKGSDSEEGSFQGGSFSPNGRFFFRIADKRNNENAGVYVYEIDGKHLDSNNEDNYWLDTETEVLDFNFIQHISFKYDGGDNEAFGELEGMDVYPEENGDIHVVYLRNEVYDDVYIFHFKAQVDSDSDGIEDIYDNCPYHSNKWQEDRDNNKVGDACDSDIDGDGVLNEEDNCPDISNPDQNDWNKDEIGDACQDSDNDGVLDIDDKCLSKANSDQADYDEDGVGDVCDNCPFLSNPGQEDSEVYPSGNPNSDGVGDACDNCINRYNPVVHNPLPYQELFSAKYTGASYLALTSPFYGYFSPDRKYYIWQPDHDLDGKGDACDFENSSYTDGFFYSQITDVKGKSELPKHYPVLLTPVNRSATVKLKMPVNSGEGSPRCLYGCPVAVHYCVIDYKQKEDELRWGQDGYCTTTEKTDDPLYKNTNFSCDFGFSHGSDDFNDLAVRSWSKRISIWRESFDSLEQYAENPEDDDARHYLSMNPNSLPTEREWYWRRDWYAEKECYRPGPLYYDSDLCKSLRNAGNYNEEFSMYYTLSTSVMNTPLDISGNPLEPNNNYAVYNLQEDRFVINPLYFRADNIYTRAFRYGQGGSNTGMMKLNYYKRFVPEIPPEIDIPEIEYCNTCYLNIARQFAFGEDGMPLPEAEKDNLGRWSLIETVQGGYNFSAQQFYLPENMNIIAEVGDQNMIAVTTRSLDATAEHELRFNTSASGADWNKIGIISNWDSNIQSVKSATERDGILYFIGLSNNVLKLIKVIPPDFVFMISNVCDTPYPVYTIQEFDVPELVEDNVEKIKMMEVAGSIYLIGTSRANEAVKTYKITENNTLMEIEGLNPPSRNILNTGKAGKYIFLTGGEGYLSESMTDIWRFDTESEEWTQVPFSLVGDFRKAITQLIDGKLVIANPIIDGNITHPAFTINNPEAVSVSEIIISYIDIPVTEVEYIEADTYCLNETGTLIKGGLEMSGECVPFTHPWYRSFATGSTIYSVAGKGDRLYVGTNNSIKVYDISDPEALVLKSTFSTNNRRVYDLEVVEGDIMYAATSGGIYKLDTVNPDALASLYFFATTYNYQYRIQLYNDKLYVGDDNGINIRDKETFTRLAYVNIDSVLDFAIANGEIALYRSSFWSAGLHIRDVETLNLKAYEYAECYTGELTTDYGAFYLSCDGYEYRFEGRPDTYFNYYPLDGDIREMQENHVYNGWTYIPDGSNVKLSTLNDVPSYCGNGVIEPGELCDGNSVACTTISSSFVSGTAYCNSTCNGYNESNCSTDGW